MAEPVRVGWKDIGIAAIGVAVLLAVLHAGAAALSLPVPQWLISSLGGAVGVAAWFWFKSRGSEAQ